METLVGQISLGAASVALLMFVARQYVTYVGRRVVEDRAQHAVELERLTRSWEDRLADQKEVAVTWRDTATSLQRTTADQTDQLERLLPAVDTMVKAIETIRVELERR